MELRLPIELIRTLTEALVQAETQEIGGILMGEHVSANVFRVREITVQRHSGGFASFLRFVQDIMAPLRRFFHVTNHDYTRFNYLGEWHSHPSFVPTPSATDRRTMHDLVNDVQVGANFAVLLIVRLEAEHQIAGTVTVFQANKKEYTGTLVQENTP